MPSLPARFVVGAIELIKELFSTQTADAALLTDIVVLAELFKLGRVACSLFLFVGIAKFAFADARAVAEDHFSLL